jgi:anti-anti-sigma regulatory factor/anti-sigma regulatory factor (Ser/Thr protein kinase)
MIKAEGNVIHFEGNLRTETQHAMAVIFQVAQKAGYKDIVLDFSKVSYVDANLMLPLASYTAYYRLNQYDFTLIEPSDGVIRRLFVNTNWAHFIEPSKYARNETRRSNNLPALQFLDGDAQHNVVNKAMEILLETIKVGDRKQFKALEWALNEITDNVLNHAESPIGGLVQIQSFPARNRVTFFVADAGLGIPFTLRKSIRSITSDSDALDRAIREGVTRNASTNQGNGLFGTFKCCEVSNGSFMILSNNAVLQYDANGLSIRTDRVPFRGSFISATIDYSTDELLEKAFVFKGKVHEPFGSREFGRRARTKIDNILVDKRNAVIFDFAGVALISSSFADEVFGKLFLEFGAMEFMRRCSFQSVDPTVMRLIDRAIAQRMKG